MAVHITLTGADTAHRAAATATASRMVLFPDGMTRHIALTGRQWEVFDQWQQDGWPMPPLIIQMVDDVTARCGFETDRENEVRLALERLIAVGMQDCTTVPLDRNNDNEFPAPPAE